MPRAFTPAYNMTRASKGNFRPAFLNCKFIPLADDRRPGFGRCG
jgi:hypothetical protein